VGAAVVALRALPMPAPGASWAMMSEIVRDTFMSTYFMLPRYWNCPCPFRDGMPTNPLERIKMKSSQLLSILISAALLSVSTAGFAAEGKNWNKTHPRRQEVNSRLNNQNRRIDKEVKGGEISKQEGAKLHKEDRQIRREERMMAAQNGGHITKQEQKTLNQQENQVSRQIGK
jgi:hypothetical protein